MHGRLLKIHEFYMHDSFFRHPLLYHDIMNASNSSKYFDNDYNES